MLFQSLIFSFLYASNTTLPSLPSSTSLPTPDATSILSAEPSSLSSLASTSTSRAPFPTRPPPAFRHQHARGHAHRAHAHRSTPTTTGSWSAVGCATDGPARALAAKSTITSKMTVELCQNFCSSAGYAYAGVEYGDECYCGPSFTNNLGASAPASDCSMACAGNSKEKCGGGYRLNVYSLVSPTATPTATATGAGGWTALGCATDGPARALAATSTITSKMSVESCQSFCSGAGYAYAGVEYGQECYCGASLTNSLGASAPASDCSMACAGNSKEKCGGGYRLNLYSRAAGASPTPTATATGTGTATGWTSVGCATDLPARALTAKSTQMASMSVETCQSFCAGYAYAGVEWGTQCFCGNSLANGGGGAAPASDCAMACSGSAKEVCGGNYRMNLYSKAGGAASVTSASASGSASQSASASASASSTAAAGAPQITEIWQTKYDKSSLFSKVSPGSPITFASPGSAGQADVTVQDASVYQDVDGFGVALTDSSALLLSQLKSSNSNNYWALLHTLFDPTDGSATAALSMIRVPLGATDFSASVYSFHDTKDTTLSSFSLDTAPSYLWSTLSDIMSINGGIKIIVSPWSPPGWMKDSGTMLGGNFLSQYTSTYAQYLLKSVQGMKNKGFSVYYVALQNEPENNNPTYPTALLDPATGAQVASQLRTLLDSNGFSSTKIVGWEHNWDQAANYPVQELNADPNAFTGASFHCYGGSVADQLEFHNAYPDKEIYFSECTGTLGSDWWSDIKWNMQNLMIGSLAAYSRSVLLYAVALDGGGNPKLPGTNSCSDGCRGVVTINSDGSYVLNQEYYSLAHGSRAVVPKYSGGPFGQRIGSTVGGSLGYELVVGAYKTAAASGSNLNRYSLVVMNWDDQSNAEAVPTTIEFRGLQAKYTFPIGVTTLSWYA